MIQNLDQHIYGIHPSFKLNKFQADEFSLTQIAYKYQQEGEVFEQEIGTFLLEWLNEKDYVVVKTSGSTGRPKKIKVLKKHMVNSALATGKFFKLPEETTALLCLPVSYIAGKMMLVRAMVLGWHIDCVQPKSNPLDLLYKRYDFCAMTPFQLDNSLARLHLVKKLIVGGGAVSVYLKKLVQGINTKIYETYGMTETVTHIAARKVNGKKNKKKTIVPFKILPDVQISVDDRNCLMINAPKVSSETIITNDVVELITYKKFLLKGRFDNVINSGGIKIHPEQVERKLQTTILQRFFITALSDDSLGEKVVLFIEKEFSEDALVEIEQQINKLSTLDKYEIPKKIYFVEKFEETHTGKINRVNTLKARLA